MSIVTHTTATPAKRPNNRIRQSTRAAISILLAAALIAQMCYPFTTDAMHPWIGIAMALLVIAHGVINRSWFLALSRGRWSALRCMQAAAIALGLAAMLIVPASGALMSPAGLAVFPELESMSAVRLVHMAGSYAAFALLSLHAGLALSSRRFVSPQSASPATRRRGGIALAAAATVIGAYGAFAFGKHGLADYITLKSHFVFWDYETPIVLFVADYASMLVFFAGLGFCFGKLARRTSTSARQKQTDASQRQATHRKHTTRRLATAVALVALSAVLSFGGRTAATRTDQLSRTPDAAFRTDSSGSTDPAASAPGSVRQDPSEGERILVAYFTWADNTVVDDPDAIDVDAVTSASVLPPGNAGLVARHIQGETGADLHAIEVSEPYPSDYDACLDRAIRESDAQARPTLSSAPVDLDRYDVVFLGYPNWWYSCPMAVLSFLEQNDLAGKTVIPFCVHGTGGLSGSVQAIRSAIPEATVLEPLSISRDAVSSSEAAIDSWISEIGYAQNPAIRTEAS